MEIRTLGDPVLREKCRDVDTLDKEIEELVEEMGETLHLASGLGLAASQVGVLKRLFVYDIGYGVRHLVNPEIVESDGEEPLEESCLSLPGISVQIPRGERVKLKCTAPSGQRMIIEAWGLMAQMFQHECDHLDGILIIDRCEGEQRRQALEEYRDLELQR